eukprot:9087583-Ditylum_brightwellii.AAC.1
MLVLNDEVGAVGKFTHMMGTADTVDRVVDGLIGTWGVLSLGRRLAGPIGRPSTTTAPVTASAAIAASAPPPSTHGQLIDCMVDRVRL